jgi:hypothetical protein
MQENQADRKARLRELASKLFITSQIRARALLCTEMLMYRNLSGMMI